MGITKLDDRTCFSNWAEALGNHETLEQEDSKILWEEELYGEGKRGILYGVDTIGMHIFIQFYLELLGTNSFCLGPTMDPGHPWILLACIKATS